MHSLVVKSQQPLSFVSAIPRTAVSRAFGPRHLRLRRTSLRRLTPFSPFSALKARRLVGGLRKPLRTSLPFGKGKKIAFTRRIPFHRDPRSVRKFCLNRSNFPFRVISSTAWFSASQVSLNRNLFIPTPQVGVDGSFFVAVFRPCDHPLPTCRFWPPRVSSIFVLLSAGGIRITPQ